MISFCLICAPCRKSFLIKAHLLHVIGPHVKWVISVQGVRLYGFLTGFSRSDPDDFFHGHDEDFSVSSLNGLLFLWWDNMKGCCGFQKSVPYRLNT